MQHYQKIRTFLATGNKLNLFEADLQPIDDLISTAVSLCDYLSENQPCQGLSLIEEIVGLLEKRERARAVIRSIIRDNGVFEDAALAMNATINLINKKLVALDSWVIAEQERLLASPLEHAEKFANDSSASVALAI